MVGFTGTFQNKSRLISSRMFILSTLKIAVFVSIVSRLFYLQISENIKYRSLSDKNRLREWKIAPQRGIIEDYFGKKIAQNTQVFQLHMFPEEVPNLEELFFKLSKIIDFNERTRINLIKRLKKRRPWETIIVSDNLSWDEFSRLNLSHTILSKRRLFKLIEDGYVSGWNDPRMPTLAGLRRRGVPPTAIRDFVGRLGITKSDGIVEMSYFENTIREHLNLTAQRRMAVLNPIKIVIENYPEDPDFKDELEAINNPNNENDGIRKLLFSREIYIEHDDFMENPTKKFFRLIPGGEVRLRYAYLITCKELIKDKEGNIIELRCHYDPESRGGNAPDGRKVKGTLHWVSANYSKKATINLYNERFTEAIPGSNGNWIEDINNNSVQSLSNCFVQPSILDSKPNTTIQFERLGYFCADIDSTKDNPIFNRTVPLRDTWGKKN